MSPAVPVSRTSWMLVALFAVAFTAFFGHSYANRQASHAAPDLVASSVPAVEAMTAAVPSVQQTATDTGIEGTSRSFVSPDILAAWLAAAAGDDAEKRTAAIAALAMAPKSAAVPVLKELLGRSDDTDKQLVLKSLRTLALREGDADGGIRDAIRQVIYHDGSDVAVLTAQTMLDEVEGGAKKTVPNESP